MLFCDSTQDFEMLMNCQKMRNSRLSHQKSNTRQTRTSQGIITRCNLTRWELTAQLIIYKRYIWSSTYDKKSNDVFEYVTSATDVSDSDLLQARHVSKRLVDRLQIVRQILEDIAKQIKDEEKLGRNATFVLFGNAFLPFGNCFIFWRTSIYERVRKNDCMQELTQTSSDNGTIFAAAEKEIR